jgi:TPR repeat protein
VVPQECGAGELRWANPAGLDVAKGLGLRQDGAQALVWYRKAAEQGVATAMNNIGWMYQHGEGAILDYSEALRWYRRAIEQREPDPNAFGNLGLMYETGQGVSRDLVQAYAWYSGGAVQSEKVRALKDDLVKRLTSAEVAEASRRAEDWQTRQRPR